MKMRQRSHRSFRWDNKVKESKTCFTKCFLTYLCDFVCLSVHMFNLKCTFLSFLESSKQFDWVSHQFWLCLGYLKLMQHCFHDFVTVHHWGATWCMMDQHPGNLVGRWNVTSNSHIVMIKQVRLKPTIEFCQLVARYIRSLAPLSPSMYSRCRLDLEIWGISLQEDKFTKKTDI